MHGLGNRVTTFMIAATLGLAACGGGGGDSGLGGHDVRLPSTFDHIDLSTPEAAVTAFAAAFEDQDYVTAALIFHPTTQAAMRQQVVSETHWDWTLEQGRAALTARLAGEVEGDHYLDTIRIFEVSMQEAVNAAALRIDLTAGFSEISIVSQDSFTALAAGILEATAEHIELELAPTTTGEWRIRQIRHRGGSPMELPFGGSPIIPPIPRTVEEFETIRDDFLSRDAEATIAMVSALVRAGDHYSLYLMLTGPAQRLVAQPLDEAGITGEGHAFTIGRFDETLDGSGFPFGVGEISEIGELEVHSSAGQTSATTTLMTPEGEVRIVLVQDSTESWRLHQIVEVGADASVVPFPFG